MTSFGIWITDDMLDDISYGRYERFSRAFTKRVDRRIDERTAESCSRLFPGLFREYAQDSKAYSQLFNNLNGDMKREMNNEVEGAVRKVNNVVEQNIKDFSDSTDYKRLQEDIRGECKERFDRFQDSLREKYEKAEQDRDNHVKAILAETDELRGRTRRLEKWNAVLSLGAAAGLGWLLVKNG